MLSFILFILITLLISFYKRYFPVYCITCSDIKIVSLEKKNLILDIRDYNDSYTKPIEQAINIPVSYLNRHINDLPSRVVHVVASNKMEKNVGIRILRKKGFNVIGYSLSDRVCNKNNEKSRIFMNKCFK